MWSGCAGRTRTRPRAAFSDTSDSAVLCAAELGIVNGYPDGTFRPQSPIERQEAAKMLAAAGGLMDVDAQGEGKSFADAGEIEAWARESVRYVSALGVMQGDAQGRFAPKDRYTREESYLTALRLYRQAAMGGVMSKIRPNTHVYYTYNGWSPVDVGNGLVRMGVSFTYSEAGRIYHAAMGRMGPMEAGAYGMDEERDKRAIENLKRLAEGIEGTEYERARAAHDALAEFMVYNEYAYNISEALANGIGTCQPFSEAYCMLCNMVGLECRMIVGTHNGIAHAWNKVCIDGEWYNVDVSGDSSDPDRMRPVIQHRFFLCSDERFREEERNVEEEVWGYYEIPAAPYDHPSFEPDDSWQRPNNNPAA